MSGTRKSKFSARQRSGALLCFLALALMYAPIAGATIMAVTGACCTGDQCPIHGNHHHSQKTGDAAMECGHGDHHMSATANCSMSCCQDTGQPAAHTILYVLISPSLSVPFVPYSAISFSGALSKISLAHAPLAPPPKSSVS